MSPQKPLFSVVIPVYNKEAYIADTLHSVLNQTLTDFELIVVDDGSTDSSLAIVQSCTDPRLKVFSKTNGGVSEARNFGIAKAQSAHIALLDADDTWHPSFLEEMAILLHRFPGCGLYASAYKKVKPSKTVTHGTSIPEGIVTDFFKVILLHLIPCASAIVVLKKALDEVGGFPIGMIGGEDDYTWSKIATKYQMAFTPKVLAYYNEIGSAAALRLGRLDTCQESWFDLYEEGNFYRNEFVARKALFVGIRYAYSPRQPKSTEIEKRTRYTVLSRKLWWDLYLLNRMPYNGITLLKAILPRYKKAKGMASKLKSYTLRFL